MGTQNRHHTVNYTTEASTRRKLLSYMGKDNADILSSSPERKNAVFRNRMILYGVFTALLVIGMAGVFF